MVNEIRLSDDKYIQNEYLTLYVLAKVGCTSTNRIVHSVLRWLIIAN